MTVSFDIVFEKKRYIWPIRRKLMKYFNIEYRNKEKNVSVLIDKNHNYIIEIYRYGIGLIINSNKEEFTDKVIDSFIDFINLYFKNSTIGFKHNTGKAIDLAKFKNTEVIEL